MKICFFSRLELTNLFGRLDHHLRADFDIIHLAYSDREEDILKDKYNIKNVVNFKSCISKILVDNEYNNISLDEIDKLFIEQSDGRFSLNSSIRYDRSFQFLNYSDCLKLSKVYYKFWIEFISTNGVDFLLHEPPAIFMTHVASNICKFLGCKYLSQSQVSALNENDWIFIEGDSGFPIEWDISSSNDSVNKRNLIGDFIIRFRSNYDILFSDLIPKKMHKSGVMQFSLSFLSLLKSAFLTSIQSKVDKIELVDHYDHYQEKLKKPFTLSLYNIWYRSFKLRYHQMGADEKYYFYPLHAEPEAAVLYRGDGIYEGQVKLIENIAEQLPPGIKLLIKDHPHRSAFTDMLYLDRLFRIPNLVFVDPNISGKSIIKNSLGVITISGTAGFEAILLNKPVFLLGQAFYMYSKRVVKVRNIRDLRDNIYKSSAENYFDDEELYDFVSKFLNVCHKGYALYFPGHIRKIKIDHEENCKTIAEGVKESLLKIGRKN
ncbi:MAG: hypothetical protein L6Q78_13285 [Bacteroidia bacterium]|nr:hypothetical protein [Bacteroidia bacterium]